MILLAILVLLFTQTASAAPVIAALAGALGGGVIATAVATTVVLVGANLAINALFAPRPRSKYSGAAAPTTDGSVAGTTVNYYDPEARQRMIIGYIKTGGMETIPPMLAGGNNESLYKILTVAGHEVDTFDSQCSVYFDADVILDSHIEDVTNSSTDGQVLNGKYSGKAFIRRYRGTSTQAVDYMMKNNVSSTLFSDAFSGKGIAYAAVRLEYDQELYRGVPQITFDINGAKMYDPRKDSTQSGGSGSHRYATPSTWEWSCNPALSVAWYLMHSSGGGYDGSEIDWSTVITAAGICDAIVTVPVQFTLFVTTGTASKSGNVISKPSGSSASWTSSVYSAGAANYTTNGVYISATSQSSSKSSAFGLTTTPTTNSDYTSIDYCWMFHGTDIDGNNLCQIYEGGVVVGNYGSFVVDETILAFRYDGKHLRYFKDGKLIRTVATTADLYFDSSLRDVGSSFTIGVDKRYTCNGQLFAAVTPDDFVRNLKSLVDSMIGKLIYTNGVWSLYAGAWQTATFSIAKSDWVSPLSFRFDGGIDTRFNRAHAWYIDPMRNWQKVECQPRTNSTYKSNDGNRDLDREFDQTFTTNEYEAQRKAEFLLRASRNQITVVGTLPPRFQDLSLWDTGIIVFDDLGWSTKTFRIVKIDVNPDGSYTGTFLEEQAGDWTDLTASEYNNPSQARLPDVNETVPSAPTSLTATAAQGGIDFLWGEPVVLPYGTYYRLMESASNSYGAASEVWNGVATKAAIVKNDSTTRYYWIDAVTTSYSTFPGVNSGRTGAAFFTERFTATNSSNQQFTRPGEGGSVNYHAAVYTYTPAVSGIAKISVGGRIETTSSNVLAYLWASGEVPGVSYNIVQQMPLDPGTLVENIIIASVDGSMAINSGTTYAFANIISIPATGADDDRIDIQQAYVDVQIFKR